jgi:hypothetical protein
MGYWDDAPMKALALVVLAFALAVPGRAAATECGGWTVLVFDKNSRESKTWCPDADNFPFAIPGWKEVGCILQKAVVSADNPAQPLHVRHLSCFVRGLSVSAVAGWSPATGLTTAAQFSLTDGDGTIRQFLVKADHN